MLGAGLSVPETSARKPGTTVEVPPEGAGTWELNAGGSWELNAGGTWDMN